MTEAMDPVHQTLDRAFMVGRYLEIALESHKVVEIHENIDKAFVKAQDALGELYQTIGQHLA